ncbi:Glycosyltransferase, GT2 family [Saccharicrinis carchari]|uniref:Glycosyltransferase, GT2 family n=1 Tax=Saccharicrinis carchari TaxID=1168039 RepID=A0A521EQQ5_SACCC|nr:glycosyltransferase family 2 protein [Saccharicrinis carchari]SMO85751.1 Glycosyltransferase, GT2 family [Saccharicrinis carchari]
MKIFVVIAVFNRKAYTVQCLQQLQKQTYNNMSVVLVDDGSTDGTSAYVQKHFPEVNLVKGTGNWWWTKSMNEGCKTAINNGAELLLTLNDDTLFEPTLVQRMVELHKQNPDAAIGTLNLIKKQQEYIFFSGIKDIAWWKAKEIKYHKAFTPLPEGLSGLHPTKCLNGRGTLIPVSIYKQVGGYNEQFVQYASDFDLALRIQKAGYRCLITYDVIVHSFVEDTGGGKSFIKQSSRTFFKSFLNPYSQTSLKMTYHYYKSHAPKLVFIPAITIQLLRSVVAFYKKRNLVSKL